MLTFENSLSLARKLSCLLLLWRDLPNSLKGQEGLKDQKKRKSGARINRLEFLHTPNFLIMILTHWLLLQDWYCIQGVPTVPTKLSSMYYNSISGSIFFWQRQLFVPVQYFWYIVGTRLVYIPGIFGMHSHSHSNPRNPECIPIPILSYERSEYRVAWLVYKIVIFVSLGG